MSNKLTALLIVACVGIHVPGCNPEDEPRTVDISGLSDQAAAEHIADTVCTHMQQCSQASISCSGTPDGETVCTGELVTTEYNECYGDIRQEILEDLERVELTAAEEQMVNDCVNGMIAMPCMTQSRLDELVDAMNRGEDPDWGEDIPAACAQMEEIFGDGPSAEPQPG